MNRYEKALKILNGEENEEGLFKMEYALNIAREALKKQIALTAGKVLNEEKLSWEKNRNETIFDLKNNKLGICIHHIFGLDGWYLSCKHLKLSDIPLKGQEFEEVVFEAQLIIDSQITKVRNMADDFILLPYDENIFFNY